ncbi:hypothetical protein P4132_15750 [Pseudomonas aeruginosa]|nr:hypothetical protein [Pseudomonas aeruginosa]
MSHLLDRLQFFKKKQGEFADGHGETSNESRAWEGAYRQRWQHDKIVRSTHGVNCTGSCLEDLREERPDHLGNPADRLPAHPSGPAQPRAARLPARGQLFLVHLQRQP